MGMAYWIILPCFAGLTELPQHFSPICLNAFRNYEQIVKAHQDNPHEGEDQVSDQVKFNVFQGIMDSLFQSFNASISVASFQELSACVFSWIEEHCEPQVCGRRVMGPEALPPSGKVVQAIRKAVWLP